MKALVKRFRIDYQKTIFSQLWAGNVDNTISELESLLSSDPKERKVKNIYKLKDAIAYLERKKPYVDCYALRKELGYRNSSNSAEKSNDLVVAKRHKHDGMSWSRKGSGSLAVISAVERNGSLVEWIKTDSLESVFKIAA